MEKNKGNVNLGKQFVERRKNELEWNEMRGMMHHLMNNISNQLVFFSSILTCGYVHLIDGGKGSYEPHGSQKANTSQMR